MKKRVRDLDDGVSVDLERKEENKKGIQGEETGKHLNAKPNSNSSLLLNLDHITNIYRLDKTLTTSLISQIHPI